MKDFSELFGNLAGLAVLIFIGRMIYVKRDGIFKNRLKDIKRERGQDKDARSL